MRRDFFSPFFPRLEIIGFFCNLSSRLFSITAVIPLPSHSLPSFLSHSFLPFPLILLPFIFCFSHCLIFIICAILSSLPFPSLLSSPFPSLPFPSLPFSSLPFPSHLHPSPPIIPILLQRCPSPSSIFLFIPNLPFPMPLHTIPAHPFLSCRLAS